jgi:glyoxylase-like metal-dependent hydrolase (beta-lactamase superfamily II)
MFPVCVTCGVQYGEAVQACPVCEDPRQYVPVTGQLWTTLEALRETHANDVRDEAGLTGIGTTPQFAIGQRALLVPYGTSNLLWDCITLLDDATAEEVEGRGGLALIAISHPHYYSAMVEWAHRFGCPVLLHAADREWVMRPDPAIELWDGETRALDHGLTLIRGGGHFPGGTMLHRPEGDLLSGDIVQVIPDRTHVSFMWSYPNLVPLPESEVRRLAATLEPFAFERIFGAWWGTVIPAGGKAIMERSAQRYISALRGEMPGRG